MKKLFLAGILSIFCVSASFAQVKFGVTAGVNASNVIVSNIDNTYSYDYNHDFKLGFQAGLVMDYSISEKFSIIPELLFSQRGNICKYYFNEPGKYDFNEPAHSQKSSYSQKFSTTLNYLQLPINAAYKFNAGSGSKLLIFAGSYLGYGLSGKCKWDETIGEIKTSGSYDVKFGSGNAKKSIDFGLNAGVGYQYEKVFFKLQYNHGLTDINNYTLDAAKIHWQNNNVAVTAGYFF